MNNKTDPQLIEAARGGDRDARANLAELNANHVFAVCLGILGNEDDAKDVSQETFLRAFSRIGQLKKADSFRPWLIGIARNLCFDHLRRRKAGDGDRRQDDPGNNIPEDYRDVHRAITRLPEKYRIPLLLYYFDGRSSESVAETLELSRAGVLTRLSRARRKLRALLRPEEDENEQQM